METEKLEEKSRAVGEAQEPEKIVGGSEDGAGQHQPRPPAQRRRMGVGAPRGETDWRAGGRALQR